MDVISFGGGIAISPTWQKALSLLGQMPSLQLQPNAAQLYLSLEIFELCCQTDSTGIKMFLSLSLILYAFEVICQGAVAGLCRWDWAMQICEVQQGESEGGTCQTDGNGKSI